MGVLTKERVIDSKSYIFDGAGGMRDQLEQTILCELRDKRYPLSAYVDTVKSGGLIFGSKDQCVVIDLGKGTRIVISNTTVGTYLYVGIYLMIPFITGTNTTIVVEPVGDIFKMQQRDALYSAAIAATESALDRLNLKVGEKFETIDTKTGFQESSSSIFKDNNTSKSPMTSTQSSPSANEWECPKCGNINQNYVGTCGCGQQKPR